MKRASRLRDGDLAGLRAFRSDYPMARALVLYGGTRSHHEDGAPGRGSPPLHRRSDRELIRRAGGPKRPRCAGSALEAGGPKRGVPNRIPRELRALLQDVLVDAGQGAHDYPPLIGPLGAVHCRGIRLH